MTRTLLFLGALSVVLVVSTGAAEINVIPGPPIMPGQKVVLSMPGAASQNSRYSWQATQGRFAGSTAGTTVVFVAPASGAATISCVEETDGTTRVRNRTLLVAQAPGRAAGRPEQSKAASGADPAPYDIGRGGFTPSGWMGDGEKQNGFATEISDDNPHAGPNSRRWVYHPKGVGWGAVAFQFPPGNWGDDAGRNLSGRGYRELSVWARGLPDKGGRYPVIQFKAGGGTDPSKKHQASFESEGDFVTLTSEWVRYTVSLTGKNLSSVISAFTFVLRAEDNSSGATFFLSEIEYR
jgi:hypothetical protein